MNDRARPATVHFSGICTHVHEGHVPDRPGVHQVRLVAADDPEVYRRDHPRLRFVPPHDAWLRVDPRNIIGYDGVDAWSLNIAGGFDVEFVLNRGDFGPLSYDTTWEEYVPSLTKATPIKLPPPDFPSIATRTAMHLDITGGTMSAVNWDPASEGAAGDWTFPVLPGEDGVHEFSIQLTRRKSKEKITIRVRVPEPVSDGPKTPLVWFENIGRLSDDRVADFYFHFYLMWDRVPDDVTIRNDRHLVMGTSAGCSNSNFP